MCKLVSSLASTSKSFRLWCERRGRKLAPLFPLLAFLPAACVNVENAAPSVTRIPAAANPAVLQHGRDIYLGQCTACHSVQRTSKYSAAEWPHIVDDMGERAKLSAAQEHAVLAYVLAARTVPPVKK